jgi:ribosomal protein L11 methyltransferase
MLRALQIDCTAEEAEVASEVCQGMGVSSAGIDYHRHDRHVGVPLVEESPQRMSGDGRVCTLSLLIPEGNDIEEVLQGLRDILEWKKIPPYGVTVIQEDDWVRSLRERVIPLKVGKQLWVVPTRHSLPESEGITITLDAGMAFGAGSHPTTRLCLEWLEKVVKGGERVVDYGCGSGILAIAALKLGAGEAIGLDLDPEALEVSRENARVNGVTLPLFLPEQMPLMETDLLVANLLAGPLEELAPRFSGYTRQGGQIALSGILKDQADRVARAYEEWFDLSSTVTDEGWVMLTWIRR